MLAAAQSSSHSERTFNQLLLNALIGGFSSSFLWFAMTFWAYLETRSVVTTSIISGFFGIASAVSGLLFGTYVDHHRKHRAMLVSSIGALIFFVVGTGCFLMLHGAHKLKLTNVWLWLMIAAVMFGSVVGNLRNIAMSTCVTLLVPEEKRDRANGQVGTVTGVSFAVTSVFSGLVIGRLGMIWALGITIAATAISIVWLLRIRFEEPDPQSTQDTAGTSKKTFDFSGAISSVRGVPGLAALIAFASFNNVLGGVYMSLLDAYGLALVSVTKWGLLWGLVSIGFIVGGLFVSKFGLGKRPMAALLGGNIAMWVIASSFAIGAHIYVVITAMFAWLSLMPVVEAAEQTVLQRAVPFERQGRVFGFAQAVESAAGPIVALSIGPFADRVTIPYMTSGSGRELFGGVLGTGLVGGIGLCFTVAGIIGLITAFVARASRSYRLLDHATRDVDVALESAA